MRRSPKLVSMVLLSLATVLCSSSRAAITIANNPPAGHIASLNVPTEPDVVTLNPDPVTAQGGATAAMQARLAAEFPAWTFTYVAGGLAGTLTLNTYNAASKGAHNGGAIIDATYTRAAGDPALANLQFIQLVTTNRPLGGATSPYIDPRPNDDTEPYYHTAAEAVAEKNAGAGTYHYYDFSKRNCGTHPCTINWRGELILASRTGALTANVYDGINWGWDFVCPADKKKGVTSTTTNPPSSSSYINDTSPLQYSTGQGPITLVDTQFSAFTNAITQDVGADRLYTFTTTLTGTAIAGPNTGPVTMTGTAQFIAQGAAGQTLGLFNTELLQLNLSGVANTNGGPIAMLLRESPTLQSLGQLDFSGIFLDSKIPGVDPQNGFEIGSFFDVFTELSLDGGQSFSPNIGDPSTYSLTPEPGTLSLVAFGLSLLLLPRQGKGKSLMV